MSEKTVEVEAIRAEAKKWTHVADRMSGIDDKVKDLELDGSAFLVPTTAVALIAGLEDAYMMHSAYASFHSHVHRLTGEATTEFDRMNKALLRIADAYEQNEDMNTKNFNDFYRD